MKLLGIQFVSEDEFIVVLQTGRREDFGYNGEFVSKRHVSFISCAEPEYIGRRTYYVRGGNSGRDLLKLDCPDPKRLVEAVKEYNKVFR